MAFYQNDDDSKLTTAFGYIDKNSDGKIDKNELQSIMSRMCGETVPEEEINSMITEADTSGDGFLQINEFIEVMKKNKNG